MPFKNGFHVMTWTSIFKCKCPVDRRNTSKASMTSKARLFTKKIIHPLQDFIDGTK